MTAYPRIALPLFTHGCLIALVLSLRTLWETTLGGVLLSPSMILVCREQDCPRQRLLTVRTFFVHPRTFLPPRHGSWAWYEMGRGYQILWPHKYNNNIPIMKWDNIYENNSHLGCLYKGSIIPFTKVLEEYHLLCIHTRISKF